MEEAKKVSDDFYPGPYHAADKKSIRGQWRYKYLFRLELLILVFAALVSIWPVLDLDAKRLAAILLCVLFAAELGIRSYIHLSKVQDDWYYGRAIAESIKTMTWKFAMRPYTPTAEAEEDKLFNDQILEVLQVWQDVGPTLIKEGEGNFISTNLSAVKSKVDWQNKRDHYRKGRILNQRDWYRDKAAKNKELGNQYFYLTILCYAAAMILSILYINNLEQWNFVPLVTVIASAILSWTQLNHFKDLKNAYEVARREIDDIILQMANTTEEDFYSAVEDTENAFSREHTVWMARKDANILANRLKK